MPLRLGLQPDLVRSKYCQDKGAQLIRQLAQSDTTTHHPEKGTLVLWRNASLVRQEIQVQILAQPKVALSKVHGHIGPRYNT